MEGCLVESNVADRQSIAGLQAQLEAATSALQRSEQRSAAGRLALEVMHEVRGPLEALGYFVYLTLEESVSPGQVRRYMHFAEEQLATLNNLASRTLGFAKSSAHPQPIQLALIAESALRIHQRAIDNKAIHLIKDLPESLVAEVHCGEILQVISNVIVNAVDSLPEKGTLSLRLRKHRDEMHITIADNGHGIPRENLGQIFHPFFTTKDLKGNGLGLALSKSIVERHRGNIRLRSSTRPGQSGTCFRISLPAKTIHP